MMLEGQLFLDDAAWQVPAHDAVVLGARRHAHALVIPVINEGDRIRGQLRRIQAAGLPVDVIIADGGSTDGALDADFVADAGVRAVLTKTGPGKLSAQLRMAYAWCLRQGYAGIVTMDGNGKDGVEAVAAMVAKLEEGCDYVQGSRYLPGGAAENTPLERTIANRLIHAPLLSLAGRHWFTDTTNGFRAYSAAYLTHPDVCPFREEFQVYNLLFYLTVRAGQLGLKVAHVPVARRYPDNGKVPTKIGGLGSKLALLKETVIAATGGYTPDDAPLNRAGLGWPLIVAICVLLPLLTSLIAAPPFSPDSWALYELAQTVGGEFYRFSHWRSYTNPSPFSAAFPPLYPVLIAAVDAAFGTGIRTGVYIAFAAFAGFALVSEMIGRRVTGAPWLGLAAAGLLLLGPNMLVAELGAGRTIPLQLLIYGLIVLGLLRGRDITPGAAAGLGLLAGLALLGRFDAVLVPLVVAGTIGWLTRRPAAVLASLGASLLAVLPWLVYSFTTFGVLFATDNSGTAAALDPHAYVTDWWPAPQLGLRDDPLAWALRVAGNGLEYVRTAAALVLSPLGLGGAMFLAAPAALAWLAGQRPRGSARLWILSGVVVAAAAMLAPQVLTGYLEHRYFSGLFWSAFLAAACWGIAQGRTRHQRAAFARIAALAAALAVVPFSAGQLVQAARSGALDEQAWEGFDAPGDVAALQACLQDAPGARVLVLGDDRFVARAGAIGALATMMEPRNMARGRLGPEGSRAFIAAWKVDYVLVMDPARADFARSTLPLGAPLACPLALYPVAAAR
jgi:hypothetical protein